MAFAFYIDHWAKLGETKRSLRFLLDICWDYGTIQQTILSGHFSRNVNDRVYGRKALFALEINILSLSLFHSQRTPPPHPHLSRPPCWLLYSTQRDDGNENTSCIEKNLLLPAQCSYGPSSPCSSSPRSYQNVLLCQHTEGKRGVYFEGPVWRHWITLDRLQILNMPPHLTLKEFLLSEI